MLKNTLIYILGPKKFFEKIFWLLKKDQKKIDFFFDFLPKKNHFFQVPTPFPKG